MLLCPGRSDGNTNNFGCGTGFLLHLLPVVVFIAELAVSQCTSHGVIPGIITGLGYAGIMLCETWGQPWAFRFALCAVLVLVAWVILRPYILCASHVNIWIIFFTHLHGLCLLETIDFKWAYTTLRDEVKALHDTFPMNDF